MPNPRVYLDWNATAPLRPEARAAMLEAMDVVGNPSSVHAEGRAAKAIVDKARTQVAALVGCDREEVVFTSGATEAASAVVLGRRWSAIALNDTEHDAIDAATRASGAYVMLFNDVVGGETPRLSFHTRIDEDVGDYRRAFWNSKSDARLICLQTANSETGALRRLAPGAVARLDAEDGPVLQDVTQSVGRCAPAEGDGAPSFRILSAHKLGGPKGVGALTIRADRSLNALTTGGGQEMGRRSGTENVVGIAGFGAAAEAALRDLDADVWTPVAALRDRLEDRLKETAPELIVFGDQAPRLPNTSNVAVPGWKGETQVIQMDLAGFAISAGSACSSGKVTASRVLMAMGFDEVTAGSAIRVSLGPTTTEAEVMAFADAWEASYKRWRDRRRG